MCIKKFFFYNLIFFFFFLGRKSCFVALFSLASSLFLVAAAASPTYVYFQLYIALNSVSVLAVFKFGEPVYNVMFWCCRVYCVADEEKAPASPHAKEGKLERIFHVMRHKTTRKLMITAGGGGGGGGDGGAGKGDSKGRERKLTDELFRAQTRHDFGSKLSASGGGASVSYGAGSGSDGDGEMEMDRCDSDLEDLDDFN